MIINTLTHVQMHTGALTRAHAHTYVYLRDRQIGNKQFISIPNYKLLQNTTP